MGLKLRLGLAVTGLALSSMFGVNMLAGVKDYVDTTGNIMVDIADGIGMVSKVWWLKLEFQKFAFIHLFLLLKRQGSISFSEMLMTIVELQELILSMVFIKDS